MSLKAIWSQNSPYSKFLLTVGIILVSATFFTLLSMILAMALYGVSLEGLNTLLTDYSNPKTISVLKFIQTVSTIGTFILPAILLAWMFDPDPVSFLSLNRKPSPKGAFLVILALLAALPLINFLGEINSRMSLPSFLSGIEKWMKDSEDKAAELTKYFMEMHSPADLILNILMIGLLPAIGEELLFRGLIQRIFTGWLKNKHVAIWLTAILFSAMHIQFYGFLPRMMLGVLLGYLLTWSGSLWLPMLAHFVNNTAAILLTWMFREQVIGLDADKIGTEEYLSVLASAAVSGLLIMMIRSSESRALAAGVSSADVGN